MNKIGVLTCHYYTNFGSTLQSIALQNTISKMGYPVKLINYHNPIHRNSLAKRLVKKIMLLIPGFRRSNNNAIKEFQKKYQKCTDIVTDNDGLRKVCKEFDVIVCGSDQIWSPTHFFPVYFADFLGSGDNKKVSYAASIGTNYIPSELIPKYKDLISDFKCVSVREEKAKELLQKNCQIDSTVVLDPTLLLDVEEYRKMSEKPKNIDKPYIFCYFLNAKNNYKDKVIRYAQSKNLEIIGVSENKSDSLWMKSLKISTGEFLWLIDHAETVFTDSYHGTIFSMIFHKPFWEFMRFNENDYKCENSRINQLDLYFNISARILTDDVNPSDQVEFDYESFDLSLNSLRKQSLSFLQKAIQ